MPSGTTQCSSDCELEERERKKRKSIFPRPTEHGLEFALKTQASKEARTKGKMDRLVTQCRPKNRIVMHRKSKDTENQILPYNFTNADNYSLQLLEEKNARSTQTLTDAKLHQIRPLKPTPTLVKNGRKLKLKKKSQAIDVA
jgi:hypothetical protein